jgi:hypothetical protein
MSVRHLPLLAALCLLTAPALAQSSSPPTAPTGAPAPAPAGSPLDLPLSPSEHVPVGPPTPEPPTPTPKEEPTLYGIPLGQVDAIVYVIDVSCSMRGDVQAYVDPVSGQRTEGTRLDRAKAELNKSLRTLPERILFNIVSFHSSVDRWAIRKVHRATGANKASATAWVEALRAQGATATGPGVVEGLACCIDEETLVVLITDGAPTAWSPDPDDHRELIRRTNARRNQIDVIGIAASGDYRAFCMGVAGDNRGRYSDVP